MTTPRGRTCTICGDTVHSPNGQRQRHPECAAPTARDDQWLRNGPAAPTVLMPHMPDAACVGTDPALFFPEGVLEWTETKRHLAPMCKACPERVACLTWAVQHREEGFWAGTSPRQRDRIRQGRAA